MKKNLVVLFLVVLVLALSACQSKNPSDPAPEVPVSLEQGAALDDFNDGDLNAAFSGVTGTWSGGNDSAFPGGTSTIQPLGSSTGMLGVTFTASASLLVSAGEYTAASVSTYYYGYVTVELQLSKAVDIVANNNSISYWIKCVNAANTYYKIYIYNSSGNFCKSTSWYGITTSGYLTVMSLPAYFDVPSGAVYTEESVFSAVKKIVFVFKYSSTTQYSTETSEIYLDDLTFQSVI